jgi:hypothetical protein
MDKPPLRTEAIAELEWVIAWLKADEPLSIAAVMLAGIAARLKGQRPR